MTMQVRPTAPPTATAAPARTAPQRAEGTPTIVEAGRLASTTCTTDDCKVATSGAASAAECVDFVEGQPPVRSFYLNGIRTPEASAKSDLQALEAKTGQDIELLYNPTQGLLGDSAEALANLTGISTAVARRAENAFRQALDKGEKVQIFAHSQGAAIALDALRNIAQDYRRQGLSESQVEAKMKQVNVVGFGGFATENSFPAGVETRLYRRSKDFIPKFAQAVCDVRDAVKSKDADLGNSLVRFGKTLGGFVAVNTGQAVSFLASKPAAKGETTGQKPDFAAVCKAVGQAVGSDHDMVVKDDFIRQNYSAGYLALYNPHAPVIPAGQAPA